jgi:elongation factor Ts
MAISASEVKKLRDRTGLGMMDCKKALEEAGGDMSKAEDLLRKQGLKAAEMRVGRTAGEGVVGSYIHTNNKIGVIAEVNCETDFAAGNAEFKALVKDVCMQIAATSPKYVSPETIPPEEIEREKGIASGQCEGKPPHIVEKIVEGKLKDFYTQVCLMAQPFIKDTSQTVGELVKGLNAKLGENIVVRRFARYEVGEEG